MPEDLHDARSQARSKPVSWSPDKIQRSFEKRQRRFTESQVLGLSERQFYQPRALIEPRHILPDPRPLIEVATPVGSIGSCFAREIKDYLVRNGYNYVQKGDGPIASHGSAPWERVFNTGCILQEIERAFGHFEPGLLSLPDGRIADPHRKRVIYSSRPEAEVELETYVALARSALTESEVFIVTLGLSEVWYDGVSGKYYAEAPPFEVFNPDRDKFRLLSPNENIDNTRSALKLLKEHNYKVQVILTVSPIPLRATFFQRSAAISNNVSKASLIYAAHVICTELEYVHYFPSYEIVTSVVETPFEWDSRHVTKDTVETIMSYFKRAFMK
jgi:hypothetical protein